MYRPLSMDYNNDEPLSTDSISLYDAGLGRV